jgi:chromate transporter
MRDMCKNRLLFIARRKEEGVMSYRQLITAFVRSGVLGYGGGPSVIPLIRFETVDNYRWMTDDEFGDILAMANALPGPIATKMAAYIGYRVKGTAGAVIAVLAHIIPSLAAMIALLSTLYSLKDSAIVKGMILGIGPVLAVMLGVMTKEFLQKTKRSYGWFLGTAIVALSFLILQVMQIHPALLIIAFLFVVLAKDALKSKRDPTAKGGSV